MFLFGGAIDMVFYCWVDIAYKKNVDKCVESP